MRNKFIFLLFVFLLNTVYAKLYTETEIRNIISNEKVLQNSKDFVNQFFTSKDPQVFIQNFMDTNAKTGDSLIVEYKLFTLLEEISYQPKQTHLENFVDVMKKYQQQAKMLHTEGRLSIAVYKLNSKARGIENIWLADDSLNKYQNLLNTDPIVTLLKLKNNINTLSQPEWLGLKSSINSINNENQIKISNFLLQEIENMQGLDKFVSRYALMTYNKDLMQAGIKYLNQSGREYMLRQMPEYFASDFVIQQLVNTAKTNDSKAFALTLLKPYMEYAKVQNFLIESLANIELSKQAAFVLSQTKDVETLIQLENIYFKSQSQQQKQQIVFILKLNQQRESQVILNRIAVEDAETRAWLTKFSRSVK